MNKTEIFIQKAKKLFPEYDYSKSTYTKAREKLIVICPKHGEFLVSPDNHLNKKSGCPKCKGEKIRKKQIEKGAQTFIEKAKKVHGDRYNYSKVVYKDSHTKVCIICSEHGEFWQTPNNHLNGHNCPLCANRQISINQTRTTQEFIKEATIKHRNKYSYSKANYVDAHTKVIITCPIHGDFEQTPDHHLRGCGCPRCNESHGERDVRNYLEEHKLKYVSQYKVTSKDRSFRIDFYLPDYNMFIEYNGEQHYVPKEYFGGQLTFQKQIERDKLLRKYCKENCINLVEISYKEDVKEVLDKSFRFDLE